MRAVHLATLLFAASCTIPNPLGFADGAPTDQCNSNPWACGEGEVCWPADEQGNYDCFPISQRRAGQKWAACRNVIAEPSCDEEMSCLKSKELQGGYCMPFCDEDHPCPGDEKCREYRLVSPVQAAFRVCVPINIARVKMANEEADDKKKK